MVYLDYTTVNVTGNSANVFTCPYKCLIMAEINSSIGAFGDEPAWIGKNTSDSNNIIKPIALDTPIVHDIDAALGSFNGFDQMNTLLQFAPIYDAGEIIESQAWQAINAVLHIFRLPESP